MNELLTKRTIVIAIIFLLVIAGGTLAYLRYSERTQPVEIQAPQKTDYAELPAGNGTVVYTSGTFTPNDMTIKLGTGFNCVVNLINKSDAPLSFVIAGQKNGPTWPAIEPGKNLLFDPRFPGITELKFQNTAKAEETFTIRFGTSCR